MVPKSGESGENQINWQQNFGGGTIKMEDLNNLYVWLEPGTLIGSFI